VHQIRRRPRRADPVQQGHGVSNANLNRIDQYTPLGSSTYQVIGTNDDGTPKYEQTTSLSAPMQGIFNSQVANQQHQQDISTSLLNNVASQYSKPIDTSGVNSADDQLRDRPRRRLAGGYVTNVGNGGGQIQRSLGDGATFPA
jgi:hypothetical protein